MPLLESLSLDVRRILAARWNARDGVVVPEPENVALGNYAVRLKATVLYADLADSTLLVDSYRPDFAAEIYKCFLRCASRLIRAAGGTITAYDGDRVMGVFIGSHKNTSAARCALKIHYAVASLIVPQVRASYSLPDFTIKHGVGIDTSDLFVARTGIRGSNDLVWVGRAANYAAKLCSIRDDGYPTYITKAVHDVLATEVKEHDGQSMWEAGTWSGLSVCRSSWWWKP